MSQSPGPWSDNPPPPIGRRLNQFELWKLAWPNIVLTVGILMVAAWQAWRLFRGDESLGIDWGGLSALALRQGDWWTPFTSMFMHAGIAHLIFNLVALASLGPLVALRFGRTVQGGLIFFAFYLVCGLIGDATFLAIHPMGQNDMIGASGAIFGLWGAVARMGPNGSLFPVFSKPVWRQTWSAVISNVVVIAIVMLSGGAIAWEAHLGGYLAGLLLISLPVLRARPIDLP